MILTVSKHVNARIGSPSMDSPKPRFLSPGDKVNVISRVLGDSWDGNCEWVLTDLNELHTSSAFHLTESFLKEVPYYAENPKGSPLFNELGISKLWEWASSKGKGLKVGIIDSGIVGTHPSLVGKKVVELNPSSSLDPKNDLHGTTMACIIAGMDFEKQEIGVAPMVDMIYSYKIDLKNIRNLKVDDLLIALNAMDNENVQIINMSFSVRNNHLFSQFDEGRKVQEKINDMCSKGCLFVCSAGNRPPERRPFKIFPACYDGVISITGYDNDKIHLNSSSCYWNGVDIAMTVQDYFLNSPHSNGTSSGAAIISGCLACAYNNILSPKTSSIKNILKLLTPLSASDSNIRIPKFEINQFIHLLNIQS